MPSLTDEEVLKLLKSGGGGAATVPINKEGLSDSEVSNIMEGTSSAQDPVSGALDIAQFTSTAVPQKSPLNVVERIVLSFADDTGRSAMLRDKYKFGERLENGKYAVEFIKSNLHRNGKSLVL